MRRIILLLTMMAATLVVASGVALAATSGDTPSLGKASPINKNAKLVGQGVGPNSDAKVAKERTNAQEERVGFNFGKVVLRNGSWSKGQTGGKNEIKFDDTPGDEGQTVGFLKIKSVNGESGG